MRYGYLLLRLKRDALRKRQRRKQKPFGRRLWTHLDLVVPAEDNLIEVAKPKSNRTGFRVDARARSFSADIFLSLDSALSTARVKAEAITNASEAARSDGER